MAKKKTYSAEWMEDLFNTRGNDQRMIDNTESPWATAKKPQPTATSSKSTRTIEKKVQQSTEKTCFWCRRATLLQWDKNPIISLCEERERNVARMATCPAWEAHTPAKSKEAIEESIIHKSHIR